MNAMSTQTQMALPPFPGLDQRGLSWHICGPLLECRCSPCTGRFCQACGVHGHTVENCRKRLFRNPGANLSGYWSEQHPSRGPMRMPAPLPGATPTQNIGQQPFTGPAPFQAAAGGGAVHHTAMQYQAPAFPTPFRMGQGGGAAINHTHTPSSNQPPPEGTAAASVNNTARRAGNRVTFNEEQHHQASSDGSQGGDAQ